MLDWGKGLLSGLGFDTGGVKEIANTALPGQEGYGWRYFDNTTVIDPQGRYYYDGQLVYDPTQGDVRDLSNTSEDE